MHERIVASVMLALRNGYYIENDEPLGWITDDCGGWRLSVDELREKIAAAVKAALAPQIT